MAEGTPTNLIDVRTPAEYRRSHARGARSVPLDGLDPHRVRTLVGEAGGPIYMICHSGGRSAKACETLAAAGVGPAYTVDGGTAAWDAAGLPIDREPAAKGLSMERQVRVGAGALVLVGSALAWAVHPAFLAIPAFIGGGLLFAGLTDRCGMAILLAKLPRNR